MTSLMQQTLELALGALLRCRSTLPPPVVHQRDQKYTATGAGRPTLPSSPCPSPHMDGLHRPPIPGALPNVTAAQVIPASTGHQSPSKYPGTSPSERVPTSDPRLRSAAHFTGTKRCSRANQAGSRSTGRSMLSPVSLSGMFGLEYGHPITFPTLILMQLALLPAHSSPALVLRLTITPSSRLHFAWVLAVEPVSAHSAAPKGGGHRPIGWSHGVLPRRSALPCCALLAAGEQAGPC